MGTAKKRAGSASTKKTTAVAKAPVKKKTATTKSSVKRMTAKKTARSPRPGGDAVTLTVLADKLDALAERLARLESLLELLPRATHSSPSFPTTHVPEAPPQTIASGDFEAALLATVSDVDRRARHGGMVPIPEVRDVFLDAGWTRAAFDSRLLEAEREFVVDLKVANDPRRLARPDLAIEEIGRGHLQYVVIR